MANIKSQKKRILTSRKEKQINTAKRSKVKTAIKFEAAIMANDLQRPKSFFPYLQVIDEAKATAFSISTTLQEKKQGWQNAG